MDVDIDLIRLAFVVGIAVSLLFYERWNLTTGSVVVPGFLAASFTHPGSVISTLVVALACHQLVNRWLATKVLLYGRTKFVTLAMTSIVMSSLSGLAGIGGAPGHWGSFAESAGYIVPALIAHDMGRQGVRSTARAVVMSSGLVLAVLIVVMVALPVSAGGYATDVDVGLAFDENMLPLAVLVSAGCAWGLQRRFGMRAGGFVGGAYVALISSHWSTIAGLVVLSIVTYVVVTVGLARVSILFGRRKFSAMLMCGSMLGWWAAMSGSPSNPALLDFVPFAGFAIAPLLLPALIANDMERAGIAKALSGLAISSLTVLAVLRLARFPLPYLPESSTAVLLAMIIVGILATAIFYSQSGNRELAGLATASSKVRL